MTDEDINNSSSDYPAFLQPYVSQIKAKLPTGWIEKPTRKGGGWRWIDPFEINNQIRIDPGRPNVSLPTQQADHVVINHNGRIIGSEGKPIVGSIDENWELAHIPLVVWLTWTTWYMP